MIWLPGHRRNKLKGLNNNGFGGDDFERRAIMSPVQAASLDFGQVMRPSA
jgi:hypothetical protein